MTTDNTIFGINGPVVTIRDADGLSMTDMVYLGENRLAGEVIGVDAAFTTIQVYEDTAGLRPGDRVFATGSPMCATLGPGLLRNIFDGIQNPLVAVAEKTGDFIARGVNASALDETARWDTEILVNPGDRVEEGTVYARVPETPAIMHKLSVPAGMRGEVIA